MEGENHADNLDEHREHTHYLAGVGHVEEDAEDVDGKQRKNHRLDGLHDDFLEVIERILQCVAVEVGQSDTDGERHDERSHYVHGWRNVHGEERNGIMRLTDLLDGCPRGNHAREEGGSREVGEEARDERGGIGHEGSHRQHASGLRADVGNGRSNQTQNDEGNDEPEELTEDAIERHEDADGKLGQEISEQYAQGNGDDDSAQKANTDAFHNLFFKVWWQI